MNLDKVYYDVDGQPRHILQMIRASVEWAANRIQEGEEAIEELTKAQAEIERMRPVVELTLKYSHTNLPTPDLCIAWDRAIRDYEAGEKP